MSRQAPCPACGAPVEFKVSASLVTVCPFCSSVIARGDKKLEDHGKVADIVETQSPLKLDLKGKFSKMQKLIYSAISPGLPQTMAYW